MIEQAPRVSRVFRDYQRGRGKNLDRAICHVSQISNGSAHQIQRTCARRAPGSAGDPRWWLRSGLFDLLGESGLAGKADHLIDQFAVLEKQDGGNRADVE